MVQPLDHGVIVALKLWYKQKIGAWILEWYANDTQDLGGTQFFYYGVWYG